MSSRFERSYRVDGRTVLNAAFWNRIMRDLDTRIVGIEEKKADFEEAEKTLLDLGLRRINETLLPAAERIFRVAELGFLVASSDEEVTLVQGQQASLTIREGDQRDLFTPSPFIALTRRSTTDDYAIARTIAYDRESGILLFDVETLVGNGGPHDDWDVAAMAGAVQAMVSSLDETQSLRQQVADDKAAVEQLKADTVQEKEAAQAAKLGADEAKSGAEDAKTAAEAALNSFLTVYRGAHSSPPENGEQGHFYFDTTLQQARVYTATGWAPLFTVTLGGIRQDVIVAEEGQTEFTVSGGGFTYILVAKNGVVLTPGEDYSIASPKFTLASGAAEGDRISYIAYYATEQTDFYTKEAADERFVRFDSDQGLDPAEQSQARENLGATEIGDALFTAASKAAGRSAIDALGPSETADKAFRRGNILGTVSQSGGVPTGAIIERGSNANGEYVRFADGTQICWRNSMPASSPPNIAAGSIFRSNSSIWTYPAGFVGPVSAGVCGAGANNRWAAHNSSGNMSSEITVWTFSTAASDVIGAYYGLYAFGRWY